MLKNMLEDVEKKVEKNVAKEIALSRHFETSAVKGVAVRLPPRRQ